MTLELIVRPEAEKDLSAAFEWYEERVPGLGSDFLLNVDAAFHAIRVSVNSSHLADPFSCR